MVSARTWAEHKPLYHQPTEAHSLPPRPADFKKVAEPVKQEVAGEGEPRGEGGESSKALNMVIKLFRINNDFCVKISDDLTKNTGDLETVRMVKHRFGLE